MRGMRFEPIRSGVPYHNRIRAAKKASFRMTMAKGKYAHRTHKKEYKELFRSGIEGILSWVLRSFGLHRCLWKGKEHFSAYVGWAVLACNLTQFARKA